MESYNPYASPVVAEQGQEARLAFIRKTYWHLAGAVGAFAILEVLMIKAGLGVVAANLLMRGGNIGWLMILGAFMLVGWLASNWAAKATTKTGQYSALGIYVLAEALIFLPFLAIAPIVSDDSLVLAKAGVVTAALVLGLTAIAFTTKTDFTFLGGILKMTGMVALGLILVASIFGLTLGAWFSAAMVIFAGGAVLYNTSAMLYHYHHDQYVSAALGLFASVAMLFWYVLRLFMRR